MRYLVLVNPALAAIKQGTEPDTRALRMIELMREKYCGPLIMAGGFDNRFPKEMVESSPAVLLVSPFC